MKKFQSTPPRGWRLGYPSERHKRKGFQSTPPRGWRPASQASNTSSIHISIHSTTRVETIPHALVWHSAVISIHSTTRVETLHFRQVHIEHAISIHSTTRVETQRHHLYLKQIMNFNPLHHEGGDSSRWTTSHSVPNFNPLHHEGGDFKGVA